MKNDILRNRMTELGLKIKDVSALSGIHSDLVSKILSGRTRNPRLDTCAKLARVLNLSLDELADDLPELDELGYLSRQPNGGKPNRMLEHLSLEDVVSLFHDMVDRNYMEIAQSCVAELFYRGLKVQEVLELDTSFSLNLSNHEVDGGAVHGGVDDASGAGRTAIEK